MAPTLSPELRARIARTRARVARRWSECQIDEFGQGIWTRWDCYAFLRDTELPILELWGDRGRARPPLTSMAIPEKPSIEVCWVENASHHLPAERPALVGRRS